MKRNMPFPMKPVEICPDCGCNTVHTNKDGDKFCSVEKCSYRLEKKDEGKVTKTPIRKPHGL